MLTKEILSVQHPFVKHCVSLRLEKKSREEAKSVLVVGEKMVSELAEKIPLQALLTTSPNKRFKAQEHYLVSEEVLKKISGIPAPDGVAAVAPLPAMHPLVCRERILVLDRISDPGNLGTLLRTALALGWNSVVMTPGTVDPFNDKALRASRGAPFFLSLSLATPEQIAELPTSFFVADLEGTPLATVRKRTPVALVLSNEGEGVAPWARTLGTSVSIPMHSNIESLNVAASGAILLYALGEL